MDSSFLKLWLCSACLLPVVAQSSAEPFVGTVTGIVEDRLALVVQPENSEDMLTVAVGRGDHSIAQPGWEIRGELVPYAGQQRLQTIWPNGSRDKAVMERLDRQLQQDTLNRGSRAFRGIGEQIPRFALWSQKGTLFHSESLRGNYVVINFIFTRCRMANMCPAATERMRLLQVMASERGVEDLRLVSITLDPDFDTPGIFSSYATDREIDQETFYFLSGPERIVENLKTQLGVLAEPDADEIIRHTLSTALVDPSGHIIYRIPGSMWDPAVFMRQIDNHRKSAD